MSEAVNRDQLEAEARDLINRTSRTGNGEKAPPEVLDQLVMAAADEAEKMVRASGGTVTRTD